MVKYESLKELFPHGVENISEAKNYVTNVCKTVESSVKSAGRTSKYVIRGLTDICIGASAGLLGTKISEGFERVVRAVPGGSSIVDYGFPLAVKTIVYPPASPTIPYIPQVTEHIGNFLGDTTLWGVVGVLAFEGAYLGARKINEIHNSHKK